jgi:Acetyltransferase (GNAT) domain
MEVVEVSSQEYGSVFREFTAVYNSPVFNDLNRVRAESVKYLFFVRGKVRVGLIAGVREQFLLSPFSAPFGGFSCLKKEIGLEDLQLAVKALEGYGKDLGLEGIRITLPPPRYDESLIAKLTNALYVRGFEVDNIDLNYHFDLSLFDASYAENLWRNARKNLRIALEQGMTFRECTGEADRKAAYNVIQANRHAKGYPLRMSYEQVAATGRVVDSYFFLAEFEGRPVAAAIVFKVAAKIVQVIYWGDLPENSALKPVNFLSYRLFEHFKREGIETVDIGPSTENSQPNFGLCEFKESIGCLIAPKLSFRKLL